MWCTFAAISAPCRVARPHNVVLDVNFYKGFWPVFIFRCLDMTPPWRLFPLSCDPRQQLPSKTAEQQSSVLYWESPAMWTGGLLWLASGDVSLYALMIAWPEQFQTVIRAAAVITSPAHHFHQILYRDCNTGSAWIRCCVCTHIMLWWMKRPVMDELYCQDVVVLALW